MTTHVWKSWCDWNCKRGNLLIRKEFLTVKTINNQSTVTVPRYRIFRGRISREFSLHKGPHPWDKDPPWVAASGMHSPEIINRYSGSPTVLRPIIDRFESYSIPGTWSRCRQWACSARPGPHLRIIKYTFCWHYKTELLLLFVNTTYSS